MSGIISSLKVRFSSDNSKFKKDMNDNTRALQEVKGKGGAAINELGRMIGVDIGRMTDSFKQFSASTKIMGAGFKGAAVGSGVLSGALKILKIALISTGIGAIVVVLGTLVAYFAGSQRGADKLSVIMKQLGAVVDVVKDRFVQFGEGIMLIFKGKFAEGAAKMGGAFKGIGAEMKAEAKEAGDLEKRFQALQDREIALTTVMGERARKYDELRLAAEDESKTAKQRRDLLTEAMNLAKQNVADERDLQKERVAINEERVAMGESTRDELRELEEARNRLNEIEAEGARKVKRLIERYNSLTHEIDANTKATIKAADEKNKFLKQPIKAIDSFEIDAEALSKKLAPIKTVNQEIGKSFSELNGVVEGSLEGLAVGFGVFLGQMMTGSAGIQDFGSLVLGTMAGLMDTVGKMAIQTGIAVAGIKAALQTMNPFVAIGAGVALVALAAAVRGGLRNAATSAGSGGTVVTPRTSLAGTTAGAASSYQAKTQVIRIEGWLKGKGSDIYAVFEKEVNRRNLST